MSLIYVNEFLLCALMFLFVLEPCNMQKAEAEWDAGEGEILEIRSRGEPFSSRH
jgi:hypothetical protein